MRKSWRRATVLWMRAVSFVGHGTRKSKLDTSFEKSVRDIWAFKHPRRQHLWKRTGSPIEKKDWESGLKKGLGVRFKKKDWESGFKKGLGVRFLKRTGSPVFKKDWESGFEKRAGSLVWEIYKNHDGTQQFYGCALWVLWGVGRENQNLIRVLKKQCETVEPLNIRVGSIFEKGLGVRLKKGLGVRFWERTGSPVLKKGLGVRF